MCITVETYFSERQLCLYPVIRVSWQDWWDVRFTRLNHGIFFLQLQVATTHGVTTCSMRGSLSDHKLFKKYLYPCTVFARLLIGGSVYVTVIGRTFHNIFVAVQECSIAYCKCKKTVEALRFLLPPYSHKNVLLLEGCSVTDFRNPCTFNKIYKAMQPQLKIINSSNFWSH